MGGLLLNFYNINFAQQKLMNSTYPEFLVRLTRHNERILMAVLLRIKEIRMLVSWVTVIVTENTEHCVQGSQ